MSPSSLPRALFVALSLFALHPGQADEQAARAAPTQAGLREELLAMEQRDQAGRRPGALDQTSIAAAQHINEPRLREIIERDGWPRISVVGADAAQAAWLIAQHADDDPALQVLALQRMQALQSRHEVDAGEVAYLEDRIAVNHGQSQRYGTQGACTGTPPRWVPKPIADAAQVDALRQAAGLDPLADYVEQASAHMCAPARAPVR
jgi:hypothetical protein